MVHPGDDRSVSAARGTTASRRGTSFLVFGAKGPDAEQERLLAQLRQGVNDPGLLRALEGALRWSATPAAGRQAALRILETQNAKYEAEKAILAGKIADAKARESLLKAMEYWVSQRNFRLEPVQDSALHKALSDHFPVEKLDIPSIAPDPGFRLRSSYNAFLIQHDWSALLSRADIDSGAIRLPFEACCFEVGVSGRRVCALVDCKHGEPFQMVTMLQTKHGWFYPDVWSVESGELGGRGSLGEEDFSHRIADLIWPQIKAIAISLDAEVATATAIRAPHLLNEQRARRGLLPIFEHRVLSLAHKPQAMPLAASEPTGRHPRAHLRRGHWRHYRTHKTWIRWMLVGDLRLGFIDKDYRLAGDGGAQQPSTTDASQAQRDEP
jgi:hypothetical protein